MPWNNAAASSPLPFPVPGDWKIPKTDTFSLATESGGNVTIEAAEKGIYVAKGVSSGASFYSIPFEGNGISIAARVPAAYGAFIGSSFGAFCRNSDTDKIYASYWDCGSDIQTSKVLEFTGPSFASPGSGAAQKLDKSDIMFFHLVKNGGYLNALVNGFPEWYRGAQGFGYFPYDEPDQMGFWIYNGVLNVPTFNLVAYKVIP